MDDVATSNISFWFRFASLRLMCHLSDGRGSFSSSSSVLFLFLNFKKGEWLQMT